MKETVNPYLFLLLKRMIEFEAAQTLRVDVPATKGIGHFILEKIGDNQYGKYWERKIKEVWSKGTFPVDILDTLCPMVETLGKYAGWKEFSDVHSNDAGFLLAERLMDKPYENLKFEDRQILKSKVELKLGNLLLKGKISNIHGKKNKRLISGKLTLRPGKIEDIKLIADLAKRVYPCPINDFNIKLPWYRKNNNIFFICLHSSGELLGNINLLPINADVYTSLKNGSVYEDTISAKDIMTIEEKSKVEFIYVEGLASVGKEILKEFRKGLSKMISRLADPNRTNLTICAIGGSVDGDKIMIKNGFRKSGDAYDKKNNHYYPFYEIKWSALDQILNAKISRYEVEHQY